MKESAICFSIAANGEHGRFYLREGTRPGHGGDTLHWCELTCNTTFGTVGHYWGNTGRSAAEFLAKIGRDYLLGKLWGMDEMVFDGEEAAKNIRRDIIADRRRGDIGADLARERWADIADGFDNEFDLHTAANSNDWLWTTLVDGGINTKSTNPQALGFWEELWPAFIAELTADAHAAVLA